MKKLLIAIVVMFGCATAVVAQDAHFSYFKYAGNDKRFDKDIDVNHQYLNPILAGFYPDPSFCRVGDTFYLVNSSFSFFPGVPIFESKDLVNWRQIGHVLDRQSQLPLEGQGVSRGIFAPDIKYNPKNKTYYMITTSMKTGNFFVKTTDPHKGWSEPILLPEINGIDPSFFFDKDGKAYIVHNAPVDGGADYEGQRAIRIFRFDTEGDSIVGDYRQIVRGGTHVEEHPIWIEGPHLYRIGKYYYLMCAEGGTGDWHSEVIFRASVKSDVMDPASWEECPDNPILTQRTGVSPDREDAVTSTGHADLLQDAQGNWWAVFLGCRAYEGPYYNTGRDTYLLPVRWKNGWPEILEKGKALPTVVEKKGLQPLPDNQLTGNFSYTDYFNESQLHLRWIFLRNPDMTRFEWGRQGLTIHPSPAGIGQLEPLSALFCRQQHTAFTAETEITFTPLSNHDMAGLALLQNEQYHFVFGKTLLQGKPAIALTRSESSEVLIGSAAIEPDVPVRLKIESNGRYYSFYYSVDGNWHPIAIGVDAVNLSTSRSGGFIGACIGLYATAGGYGIHEKNR
ncbi:MAG: glycoside hydrolase family 43 protein [Prevotella sp.]|nr:glycoside hydrolase family 43 protein [Prevotella sp.]